jgi:hypothetical protein
MASNLVKKITIYKWRFWIGYGTLSLLMLGLLLVAMFYVPGGISEAEKISVIKSASLNPRDISTLAVADLPYHSLQKMSFHLFGLSNFSIKLPSIIIAFISAIGLIFLLRHWFKPNVSIIAAIIVLVSSQFLHIAQEGTAGVMMIFFSVFITLFAYLMISRTKTVAKLSAVALAITLAASLYTPLMVYIIVALILGAALHPHMRYTIKKAGKIPLIISSVIALLLFVPLAFAMAKNPQIIKDLVVPGLSVGVNFIENIKLLGIQFFDFAGLFTNTSATLTPLYSLPVLMIACVGIYSLARRKHSVQNYVITAWLIMIIPIVIVHPLNDTILFVPIALLIATGIDYILWYWYRLFPHNPYARIAGLIPLIVLIGGIVVTGTSRYFYTFNHDPNALHTISKDLSIVSSTVKALDRDGVLIVDQSEKPFYDVFAATNKLPLSIETSSLPTTDKQYKDKAILATRMSAPVREGILPVRVITNNRATTDSDRLYIYKNTAR